MASENLLPAAKTAMNTSDLVALTIATADGTFTARYTARGLAGLAFPGGRPPATPSRVPARVRQWHRQTARALRAVLAGRPPRRLPPLDLTAGTAFQQAVWRQLRRIPTGQTRSYGELAGQLGRPGAARAVGAACGANPIPLLLPCHRVIASNGGRGGFSGGLAWKLRLLQREGAVLDRGRSAARR